MPKTISNLFSTHWCSNFLLFDLHTWMQTLQLNIAQSRMVSTIVSAVNPNAIYSESWTNMEGEEF